MKKFEVTLNMNGKTGEVIIEGDRICSTPYEVIIRNERNAVVALFNQGNIISVIVKSK